MGAGAMGCVISGSGSTMIAFTQEREEEIGRAMQAAFEAQGVAAQYLALGADTAGAQITEDNILVGE